MKKYRIPLFAVLILLVFYFVSHPLMKYFTAHHNFLVPPIRQTPTDVGLYYKEIPVSYHNKKFIGWLVSAKIDSDSPSNVAMIFVGRGEGLSSFVKVQKLLYQNGISSFVFNYGDLRDTSDFHSDKDAKSSTSFSEIEYVIPKFFKQLKINTPHNSRFFLLGHSIGCAILSQYYPLLDTNDVQGVILCSPFESMRKFSSQHGFPKILLFIIPKNIFNNDECVPKIKKPILFVHSKADSVNFYVQGQQVFLKSGEPKKFISYENFTHNYIVEAQEDFWQPILEFIKQ